MRHVNLRPPAEGEKPTGVDGNTLRRRTGHLWARMSELLGSGFVVQSEFEEEKGFGWVSIQFPNLESDKAMERLQREYGIQAALTPDRRWVLFSVTAHASFEDMDYVQAAVMDLLNEG